MLDFSTVKIEDNTLWFLDQTKLPGREEYLEITDIEVAYDAIKRLIIRGAPAIGVGAAYAMVIEANNYASSQGMISAGSEAPHAVSLEEVVAMGEYMAEKGKYLISARPTAVNLEWAVRRMITRFEKITDMAEEIDRGELGIVEQSGEYILSELYDEAEKIMLEDQNSCYMMGMLGLGLLEPGMTLLTHCNAGALATTGYGTALAPIHLGQEKGYDFHVYADETRPLLQGARLTAWELQKSGVDVTLIADNMAASLMRTGRIDAVLVGCDRMAANGDGANKIGTSAVAVLAKEFGIPFYMFVPLSTIDMSIKSGEEIVIENRDPGEICEMWYAERMAPEGIKTYNPAFDVTPHEYITAVVTEAGVFYPPYDENFKQLVL